MTKNTDKNNHIIELVDVCKEFDGVTIVENIGREEIEELEDAL